MKTYTQFHITQFAITSGQHIQTPDRYCSMLKTDFLAF